jgi:hypothetical protein
MEQAIDVRELTPSPGFAWFPRSGDGDASKAFPGVQQPLLNWEGPLIFISAFAFRVMLMWDITRR